ncbi:hypothetical protein Tco_1488174, partial [Tanacetum coccineum]
MQTQEDHSNTILALNVDSSKVDLVVIQITYSEKEDNQLQKQLDKDDFQEDGSMEAFWVINRQFQKFIDSQFTLDYDSQMTDKYFIEYTGIKMQTQESKVDAGKALDSDLGNEENFRTDSTVQDERSRPGNDTNADDADIRPIYDEEPMTEYPEQRQVKSQMLDSSPDN